MYVFPKKVTFSYPSEVSNAKYPTGTRQQNPERMFLQIVVKWLLSAKGYCTKMFDVLFKGTVLLRPLAHLTISFHLLHPVAQCWTWWCNPRFTTKRSRLIYTSRRWSVYDQENSPCRGTVWLSYGNQAPW